MLQKLREANISRCTRWHGPTGVNDWTPEAWSNAAAGEMGEVCNETKKLSRLTSTTMAHKGNNNPESIDLARDKIKKEIGDVIVYLDLLAARLNISLEEAIITTFNRVSEREGFPERL